jgi:hypothetical protein
MGHPERNSGLQGTIIQIGPDFLCGCDERVSSHAGRRPVLHYIQARLHCLDPPHRLLRRPVTEQHGRCVCRTYNYTIAIDPPKLDADRLMKWLTHVTCNCAPRIVRGTGLTQVEATRWRRQAPKTEDIKPGPGGRSRHTASRQPTSPLWPFDPRLNETFCSFQRHPSERSQVESPRRSSDQKGFVTLEKRIPESIPAGSLGWQGQATL